MFRRGLKWLKPEKNLIAGVDPKKGWYWIQRAKYVRTLKEIPVSIFFCIELEFLLNFRVKTTTMSVLNEEKLSIEWPENRGAKDDGLNI